MRSPCRTIEVPSASVIHTCGEYGACGAPVYFVKDGWYEQHVMPASKQGKGGGKHGGGHGKGHGKGRD